MYYSYVNACAYQAYKLSKNPRVKTTIFCSYIFGV